MVPAHDCATIFDQRCPHRYRNSRFEGSGVLTLEVCPGRSARGASRARLSARSWPTCVALVLLTGCAAAESGMMGITVDSDGHPVGLAVGCRDELRTGHLQRWLPEGHPTVASAGSPAPVYVEEGEIASWALPSTTEEIVAWTLDARWSCERGHAVDRTTRPESHRRVPAGGHVRLRRGTRRAVHACGATAHPAWPGNRPRPGRRAADHRPQPAGGHRLH